MDLFHIPDNFFLHTVLKITLFLKIACAKAPITPVLTKPLGHIGMYNVRINLPGVKK